MNAGRSGAHLCFRCLGDRGRQSFGLLFLLFYSYVYDCLTCMNVLHQVQCLQRLERARDPPGLELQLGVTVWVLGIEPGTSAKATGAHNR